MKVHSVEISQFAKFVKSVKDLSRGFQMHSLSFKENLLTDSRFD